MSEPLRVWDNGSDFVIAASAEDASAVMQETCGPGLSEEELLGEDGEWTALDPAASMTIEDWDNAGKDVRRTNAEWVAEGRGFLASRNL